MVLHFFIQVFFTCDSAQKSHLLGHHMGVFFFFVVVGCRNRYHYELAYILFGCG